MIKYNNNPMNNNFWHLFTQLISQMTRIHKKTNIAITEWEQHFDKLQHGLTFDENNPDVIESSENDNCNKKLIQNDAGPSQNKTHDRYKTHSLNENAENITKESRAVPKRLNIDKKKTLDVQPESQRSPHQTFNKTGKSKTEPQTECQSFCLCNQKNIWDSKKKCHRYKFMENMPPLQKIS